MPSIDPMANNPVDLTLINLRARINSTAAVAAANASNFCGFNNWAPGAERDITGKNCVSDFPDDAGSPFFQIFRLETEDRLFVGETDAAHDGETAARPQKPTPSGVFLRICACLKLSPRGNADNDLSWQNKNIG